MSSTNLCVYHGGCQDGFASAWVVRKALKGDVDFVKGVHGNPIDVDVVDKNVYFVDFCPPQQELQEILLLANTVTVIDHHRTACVAQTDLVIQVPRQGALHVVFSNDKAGSRLTWEHFFPDVESTPPRLLNHINDRDLWKFNVPGTREICTALFSYPYEFSVWDEFMEPGLSATAALRAEGASLERKHWQDINTLLPMMRDVQEIAGHTVPVANLPVTMVSDAANVMAKGWPFAACYYDTPGWRNYSLHSHESGVDVSEIAKQFGGGGHARAAGFRVSMAHGSIRPGCGITEWHTLKTEVRY